jgi:hypothetical protein
VEWVIPGDPAPFTSVGMGWAERWGESSSSAKAWPHGLRARVLDLIGHTAAMAVIVVWILLIDGHRR